MRVTHVSSGISVPLQQLPVTLQPGGTFSVDDVPVFVPGWVPAGEYTYAVHLGAYSQPMNNMGFDEFTFVKEDAGANGPEQLSALEGTRSGARQGEHASDQMAGGWLTEQPANALAAFTGLERALPMTATSPADKESLPGQFSLSAYPNPFNTEATIAIDLPERTGLTLEVYNLHGQLVTRLADHQTEAAGRHSFTFNATDLASGVYLIRAGGWSENSGSRFSQTQKIMLIR